VKYLKKIFTSRRIFLPVYLKGVCQKYLFVFWIIFLFEISFVPVSGRKVWTHFVYVKLFHLLSPVRSTKVKLLTTTLTPCLQEILRKMDNKQLFGQWYIAAFLAILSLVSLKLLMRLKATKKTNKTALPRETSQ